MYESRRHPLLPPGQFVRRQMNHILVAAALVVLSVGAGMAGYAYYEHLPWRDGFLNSAMLLGGMGPVDPPHTNGGKLFAGFYALYAGLVFILGAGIISAPLFHRLVHKFHLEDK